MSKARKHGKAKLPPVRVHFDDGDVVAPLNEIEAQRLREMAHLLKSDEPRLREMGERRLAAAARGTATAKARDLQSQRAATHERRKDCLRRRILDVMGKHKRAGGEFKALLQAWERDTLDGLRVSFDGDSQKHVVTDENGADDSSKSYALSTLMKMFSKS